MSTKNFINTWSFLDDLVHLIYPSSCIVCERELSVNDNKICSFCSEQIAYTDFHLYDEPTAMDKLFWGRVTVDSTYAHIFFQKNAASQKILFNLKYKDDSLLGEHFGEEIGKRLLNMKSFSTGDILIPIPLHHKKAFIRGYNQSEKIARGISTIVQIPVNNFLATRTTHSSSQTKKNRFQRWENVNNIFNINPTLRKYHHAIIVDDVITTGATTESLIRAIQKSAPDIRISVVTLAIA